jgi:hypothetical protein
MPHAAPPSPDEVLAYVRERRETLLEVTDDELNAPAPSPGERCLIAGAPNISHVFLFAS